MFIWAMRETAALAAVSGLIWGACTLCALIG